VAEDPNLRENLKRSKSLNDPRAQPVAGLTDPAGTPEDIRLLVRIVFQAREALAKRQATFLVLLWPLGDKGADRVASELQQAGVEVISTDRIFSENPDPPESYHIEMDNHPTKLAAERIARCVQQRIRSRLPWRRVRPRLARLP
jgi:hypothetical protein